ncbi:MAG: hypothetical protein ACE5PM_05070 [Candidatus Hydrothermarchaeales archaeon]
MRMIILACIIFLVVVGGAYADYDDPSVHPGALRCWPCHVRFSYKQPYAENLTAPVRNNDVLQFRACAKEACHDSRPGVRSLWGGKRYGIHVNSRVCKNCHAAINGTYDIHTIHLKPESILANIPQDLVLYENYNWTLPQEVISDLVRPPVDCNTCHWTPEGYNSPLASVPPYEELYIAGSALKNTSIRKPPWNKDCGYCHPSARGAERLHDVHMPVILKACPICHSPVMLTRPDLVSAISGRPLPGIEEEKGVTKAGKAIRKVRRTMPGRELSNFFEKIAEYMLAIFYAMK